MQPVRKYGKKFSYFDGIQKRDRQTDRQTDILQQQSSLFTKSCGKNKTSDLLTNILRICFG